MERKVYDKIEKEERHPNINEIIKVLEHLNNKRLRDKTISQVLKIYQDWNENSIKEINEKFNHFKQ